MNRAGMLRRLREMLRGRDVAVVYGVLVVVISVVVAIQPSGLAQTLVDGSSTSLVNLRQRPLLVLFASPFVVYPAYGLWLVPPMVVAYGVLQRWLGRVSVIVVAVLGHVGATLFVATMEVTSLARGLVGSSISVNPDVGISYGLAAAAGVLVVRVGAAWRRQYVIVSLIVIVGQVLVLQDFTGLGHVIAWWIGLAVAVPVASVIVRTGRPSVCPPDGAEH